MKTGRRILLAGVVAAYLTSAACFLGAAPARAQDAKDIDPLLEAMFDPEREVQASTRYPQALSRVAENVTVITAPEIRALNAHSLNDVLQGVTGLQVDFAGQDFVSESLAYIQGSRETHVLVLVDEIPWNNLAGGNAILNTIPVEIIERIEIIKGPASSTWGSALGGVINIITKRASASGPLAGVMSGSYGERNSHDGRAALTGSAGGVGYFLYAGDQHSDGLVSKREYDNRDFFGKLEWAATDRVTLGFSAGASNPRTDEGDLTQAALLAQTESKTFWLRANAEARVSPELDAHLSFYRLDDRFMTKAQEDGQYAPRGSLFKNQEYDSDNWGGSGQFVWRPEGNTVVAGVDYRRGELDYAARAGEYLQSPDGGNAPAYLSNHPDQTTLGVYLNDTAALGDWTLIPGVRFDHSESWGWFFSPSLGLTLRAGAESLVRASVARGFNAPPLSFISGGAIFLDPNPDLKPEEVWSYQLGFETDLVPSLWFKVTGFFHDLKDAQESAVSPDNPNNAVIVNSGHVHRTGFEVEAMTASFLGFAAQGGFATVYIRPRDASQDRDTYTCDLGLRYEKDRIKALLTGHFIWWDNLNGQKGSYNDFLWDLHATVALVESETHWGLDGFFSARNLFNGSQYSFENFPNPKRWVEAGLRWYF